MEVNNLGYYDFCTYTLQQDDTVSIAKPKGESSITFSVEFSQNMEVYNNNTILEPNTNYSVSLLQGSKIFALPRTASNSYDMPENFNG